jgi:type IV pilus assembly protein PilM
MRTGILSRPWLGLDVGSYSIKLVALQGGAGMSRHWLGETLLPKPGNEPDRLHSTDVVARVIADCLDQAGLSPRSFRGVTMGIAGSDVIIKQISLPLIEESEVAAALRFEARKHLPFDPQGMVIDYQILGRYPSEKRVDVLLGAVSDRHLEQHLAPLRLLGMDADILDATPLAVMNALVHARDDDRGPQVLLDIGHTSSHLIIYQRGEPCYTRRLDFGGKTLSRRLAESIRVPFEEAEEWKLAVGSDEPGLRVDWESREMVAILESLRGDLLEDLRRSFAFYRTIGHIPDSVTMWISGGSAHLPGLAERLSELLRSPVERFNPIESLTGVHRGGPRPAVAPQFAQALGLALRTA